MHNRKKWTISVLLQPEKPHDYGLFISAANSFSMWIRFYTTYLRNSFYLSTRRDFLPLSLLLFHAEPKNVNKSKEALDKTLHGELQRTLHPILILYLTTTSSSP